MTELRLPADLFTDSSGLITGFKIVPAERTQIEQLQVRVDALEVQNAVLTDCLADIQQNVKFLLAERMTNV